jgi:hypothetical protein
MPPESPFASPFVVVCDFFARNDWPINVVADESILYMVYQGDNGRYDCLAGVRNEEGQFLFYSVCPVPATEDRRAAVAEFVARANYDMVLGNFELDFDDGEIRYKTSAPIEGAQLSPAIVALLVLVNLRTMDQYLPGILSVVHGNISPRDAIEKIERAQ